MKEGKFTDILSPYKVYVTMYTSFRTQIVGEEESLRKAQKELAPLSLVRTDIFIINNHLKLLLHY